MTRSAYNGRLGGSRVRRNKTRDKNVERKREFDGEWDVNTVDKVSRKGILEDFKQEPEDQNKVGVRQIS